MTDTQSHVDSALVRTEHPWADHSVALLYDAFPFNDDLPFYRELAQQLGGNVLEVACGTGRVLTALVDDGHRVVGLDSSPPMLAIARDKLASLDPALAERATLVEGDMRSFDLSQTFDLAIVAVKSFSYLLERRDQQLALSAMARHLRPGGLLAIDLLHPLPEWVDQPPGSMRQDLVHEDMKRSVTVARTEAVVRTDLARQVRVFRSAYEIVHAHGSLTKRYVEWSYRYIYRFEAEQLLERAGFQIRELYGGYNQEPFTSESTTMMFLATKPQS